MKVTLEDAKAVAEQAKQDIRRIWEVRTFFSGPKLPRLEPSPSLYRELIDLHHPFTSMLGIPVAPLRKSSYEGSIGVFLTYGGTDLMALTAAHVARRPLPPTTRVCR